MGHHPSLPPGADPPRLRRAGLGGEGWGIAGPSTGSGHALRLRAGQGNCFAKTCFFCLRAFAFAPEQMSVSKPMVARAQGRGKGFGEKAGGQI